MNSHPLVREFRQTCFGCPEQYEGRLTDGRWFYFRYRNGWASLAIDNSYDAAMGRQDVGTEVGDGLQGIFDSPQQRDEVFAALLRQALSIGPQGGAA